MGGHWVEIVVASTDISFRLALPNEAANLRRFIDEHGQNEWNYLAEPDLTDHLNGISNGETSGIIAELDNEIIGIATYLRGTTFATYHESADVHGHISEVVVARDRCGQGIGTALLKECVAHLAQQGIFTSFAERHADNAASAGMMKKAGFEIVTTFADPDRRATGSRQTSICRYRSRG